MHLYRFTVSFTISLFIQTLLNILLMLLVVVFLFFLSSFFLLGGGGGGRGLFVWGGDGVEDNNVF